MQVSLVFLMEVENDVELGIDIVIVVCLPNVANYLHATQRISLKRIGELVLPGILVITEIPVVRDGV